MKLIGSRAFAAVTAALALSLLGACAGGDDDGDPQVASLDDGTDESTPDDTATDDTTTDDTTTDDTTTDDVGSTDPQEAMLEFTECMRDHGIDMADPQFDGEGRGGITLEATPENEDDLAAAQEACQPLLENARSEMELDPEQEAEMREQLLDFAECMRDHGIDMPDPQFSDDGGFVVQAGPEGGGPREDPDFAAAAEECQAEGGPGFFVEGDEAGPSTEREDG
jgi:hypothetical protein